MTGMEPIAPPDEYEGQELRMSVVAVLAVLGLACWVLVIYVVRLGFGM